jgi:hypothetical protein
VTLVLLSFWTSPGNEPCGGVVDQNFLPQGGFNPSALCEWEYVNLNGQITVPVNNADPFVTISSNVSTVTVGSPVIISWSTQSAVPGTCDAIGGNSGDGWIGSVAASGSQSITEQSPGTYTYAVGCEVGYESFRASVQVTVQAASSGTGGSGSGGSGSSGGGSNSGTGTPSSGGGSSSSGSSSAGSSSGGGGAMSSELLVLFVVALLLRIFAESRIARRRAPTHG